MELAIQFLPLNTTPFPLKRKQPPEEISLPDPLKSGRSRGKVAMGYVRIIPFSPYGMGEIKRPSGNYVGVCLDSRAISGKIENAHPF